MPVSTSLAADSIRSDAVAIAGRDVGFRLLVKNAHECEVSMIMAASRVVELIVSRWNRVPRNGKAAPLSHFHDLLDEVFDGDVLRCSRARRSRSAVMTACVMVSPVRWARFRANWSAHGS